MRHRRFVLFLILAGLLPMHATADAQIVTSNSVQLSWTTPGDDGLSGTATQFDLRYSASVINAANFASATRWASVPSPTAPGTRQSATITGLQPSTSYWFAIKTADEVPNWSVMSNVISRTTLDGTDVVRPAQVTTLAITGTSETTATLAWTAVGDDSLTGTANLNDIRYSTSPITNANWTAATQASGEPAPTTPGTAQSLTVSGLTQRTTYYFAIRVADEVGSLSALSNVPSATTLDATDVVRPAQVTTLAITGTSETTATLAWTAVGDDSLTGIATLNDIRFSTSPITDANWAAATQASGEPAPTAPGTAQSRTVSGLTGRTTYYFAIRVADDGGNLSALSNIPSATTPDQTRPAAPIGLSAVRLGGGVRLSWSPSGVPDLAGYFVYRALVAGGTFARLNGALLSATEYADDTVPAGTETVWYQVTASDGIGEGPRSGALSFSMSQVALVTEWTMEPGYPNPSAAGAVVHVPLVVPTGGGNASLEVVNNAGQRVRFLDLGTLAAGSQVVQWDGRSESGHEVAPGVYTAWLTAGSTRTAIRLVRVP